MKFSYQARTKDGKIQTGIIEATSQEAALDILHKNQLFPTFIQQVEEKKPLFGGFKFSKKVSQKDVVVFSRQLATMLSSRVPPAEALDALALEATNPEFQEIISHLANDIREGTSLSRAFSRFPKVFSNFYINLVKSGEVAGNLAEVLERAADHLEKDYDLHSKMVGAMIYPAIILVVFVLIFIVLMVFVIPQLTKILIEGGKELPFATRVVIAISNFFINWWWVLLIVVILLFLFFYIYPKTQEGKEVFDRLSLKLPIIGNFFRNIYLARFAENLSTLISAGIPIAQALEVTADLIGNTVYKDIILSARDNVTRGENISSTLERFQDTIPPIFVQMVSVGEKTGRLSSTLMDIVRFYQRDIDVFINSLSSILDPILIIGLAVMVGFLAASVFLPLYQMGSVL
jgi:type IV pilus assembly protein PilC